MARARAQYQRGFSLIELLIILAVLSLLLTIVVPSMDRASALARRTACAKRLYDLTGAYHIRTEGNAFTNEWPFDVHNAWAIQLQGALSYNENALICLDDQAPRKQAPGPTLEREWFGDPDARMDLELYGSDPVWEEFALSEVPTQDTPHVWKVNSEVYDSLNLAEGVNQDFPKYTRGSNPDIYYLLVEDAGGNDRDFEDLVFKVERQPNGDMDFSVVHRGITVHTHDLIGDQWVVDNIPNGAGPYTFKVRGPVSYGMSKHANRAPLRSHTILALDYEEDVVYPGGTQEVAKWDDHVAPRHLGKCNVAFADGSVQAFTPDAINPDDPANRAKYWNPPGVSE